MTTAPAITETLLTGDDLLAMGDIGPCELIDGRIVPLSPAGGEHGYVETRAGRELDVFVEPRKLGWVMGGEVGIYTRRNPDRVRAADVLFISRECAPQRPKGFLTVAPELVVEVMSPNDTWQEVRQKVAECFAIGVLWVWIVEPENRSVVVFRSATEVTTLGEGDTLRGEGTLAGFELAIARLFE